MMENDIFVSEYLKNLNTVPADNFPQVPEEPQEDLFDGVSKDVLDLQDLEQKLNDVNTALTNFESKSNQWHNFLIQSKNDTDFDAELLKQYETDQAATLASINKIKGLLLQINTEMSVLKDTLKQD